MSRPALLKARKHNLPIGKALVRAFYDIYALNELYFRLAGGDEDYGYVRNHFGSFRAEMKIREAYESLIPKFHAAIIDALERSVRSEIRYGTFSYLSKHLLKTSKPVQEHLSRKGLSFEVYRKSRRTNMPLNMVAEVFSCDRLWATHYGGPPWAKATSTLIEAKKAKTLKDMFFWVDRILDLQHNSGFILDKTEFHRLVTDKTNPEDEDDWRTHLDIRAELTTIKHFEPYVSFSVRKLMVPHYHKLP